MSSLQASDSKGFVFCCLGKPRLARFAGHTKKKKSGRMELQKDLLECREISGIK